jgi:pyridoxal phosphate enzyme (YggS family)
LDEVRRRVEAACRRAGRDAAGVSIAAVAKTHGPEAVREGADCGLTAFAESRVQEAAQKIPLCPGNLEWHMVGHLQRNKVRAAVRLFRVIHSVDSWRLLEGVDRECAEAGCVMPVMIEVNVSGERSKFGAAPEEVPSWLERSGTLVHVSLIGLMTIPPFTPEPEQARPYFRRLRELRDQWRERTGIELRELSMGMSGDFETAVEEGATWIRLGTALFGPRPPRGRGTEEGEES